MDLDDLREAAQQAKFAVLLFFVFCVGGGLAIALEHC